MTTVAVLTMTALWVYDKRVLIEPGNATINRILVMYGLAVVCQRPDTRVNETANDSHL